MSPSLEEAKPWVWRTSDGKTMFEHICIDDRYIKYSLPAVIWTVLKEKPLTLRAPINCGFCGLHGRFEEGSWIPLPDLPIAGRGID